MKPLSETPPRFLCRLTRWRIALMGQEDQVQNGGAGAGHVASCPECRQYFAATQQLDSTLRREASRRAAPVPDGMEQRIMQAVRLAPATSEPMRSRRNGWIACGGLAAGAALALLLVRRAPEMSQERLTSNGAASDADVRAIVEAARTLPRQLWSTLQPTAKKLTDENPLQTELNSVYSNAQSAVSFLELNFLPSSSTPAPRAGAEQRG